MHRKHFFIFIIITFVSLKPLAGEIKILSRNDNGDIAAFTSNLLDVSSDGSLVLMAYTNILLPSDDPDRIPTSGLYIRNLIDDTQTLVVNGEAEEAPFDGTVFSATMSNDGRYIAFDAGILSVRVDVFLIDTQSGGVTHISSGADASCYQPKISSDGRYVVFFSTARNFPGTGALLPSEGRGALYRYDSQSGSIALVSVTAGGVALNTGVGNSNPNLGRFDFDFSRNGQYIVFGSEASNVIDGVVPPVFNTYLYRRNLETGTIDIVNRQSDGTLSSGAYANPSISDDGNRVAFIGGFLGFDPPHPDIPATFSTEAIALDFTSNTVWWVSRTIGNVSLGADFGSVANVEISGDGSVVAMEATSENLVEPTTGQFSDIFRVDLSTDGTSTIDFLSGPTDDSNTNVRVDAPESLFLPSNGAYIAWKSTEAQALANLSPLRTHKQVVAVGDFSSLSGGKHSFVEWASVLPEGRRGKTDEAFPDGIPNLVRYTLNLPTDRAADRRLFRYSPMAALDLGIGTAEEIYETVTIDIRSEIDPTITWSILTGRTLDELASGDFQGIIVGEPVSQGETLTYTLRTPFTINEARSVFLKLRIDASD